ncbi:arginase [Reichenbachiella sp. MALMAid0571]|uniref:arginase n=1 Tax=Reichenbachiella sp. MALMAid0571 TaxID=3143939 RepID=UPI0032DF7985
MTFNRIKIIKNRSDIGAGTRGSDLGVDAIEIAAINQENNYFNQYGFEDIPTHNETIYDKVNTTFAKRIGHVHEQCMRVCNVIGNNLKSKNFPLVLSGDHSSALGTISGIKTAYPNKRLGVIWIDAHADLHSPYTSLSGNVHGMPVAAALSIDNLEAKVNAVSKETEDSWIGMKNTGIIGAKIHPEYLIYFGVRDTEIPEEKLLKKLKIKNYKVEEVRYRGIQICLDEAVKKLSDCEMIYISFDVDSMDCDLISKGTGTPVSKGFDQYEVINIINGFISTNKVVCLEIVEINPLLDLNGNKMAEAAFEVLDAVTNTLEFHL